MIFIRLVAKTILKDIKTILKKQTSVLFSLRIGLKLLASLRFSISIF